MTVRSLAVLAALLSPAPVLAALPVMTLDAAQSAAIEKVVDFQSNQRASHENALAAAYDHLFKLQGEKKTQQRRIEAQELEVTRWINDLRRQVAEIRAWPNGYVFTPNPDTMT